MMNKLLQSLNYYTVMGLASNAAPLLQVWKKLMTNKLGCAVEMGKQPAPSIQACGMRGKRWPGPRFLDGAMERWWQTARGAAVWHVQKGDPIEPRWVGTKQSAWEQRTVPCVAKRGPEVS